MTTLLAEDKKRAYEILTNALLDSVEKGEMTDVEMGKSARYIRFGMETLRSHEDLLLFLRDTMNHWSAFKSAFVTFKGEHVVKEDTAKMAEIQSKLQAMIAN